MGIKEKLTGFLSIFTDQDKELREKAIKLLNDLGERYTVADVKEIMEITEKLIEHGDWKKHMVMANLCGKLIYVKLNMGQDKVQSASKKTKEEILDYATQGLLHLRIVYDQGGKKLHKAFDQSSLDAMEQWREAFVGFVEATKPADWQFD